MCRLFAVTSNEPLSPMMAIDALNVMKEGHDGSGLGLFLTDLGGDFEKFKNEPILSGIFSNGNTTNPSGFFRSLASFARNLFGATPTEAVSFVSWKISSLIFLPISSGLPNRASLP